MKKMIIVWNSRYVGTNQFIILNIVNIKLFGNPIADSGAVPVWNLPNLHYDEWFYIRRELGNEVDRLLYGVFKGISKPFWFGFSYYFFTLAFYLYFAGVSKKLEKESYLLTKYVLNVILIFFFFVIITYSLGHDIFIKNYRYQMTLQPFIALFSAAILYKFIPKNNT